MSANWQEKLIAELKRDYRRTGLLAVLLIVMIVMVIRQFIGGGDPAPARANEYRVDKKKAAASTPAPPAADSEAGAPAASPVRAAWLDPESLRGLPAPVFDRDPFEIDYSRFLPVESENKTPEKATPTADQEQQRREAEIALIRADAAKLNLQSVLMGAEPRVIINGDIYHAGQRVPVAAGDGNRRKPFVLRKITSTSAMLERDGYEVTLRME